jgi:hypothetical protein
MEAVLSFNQVLEAADRLPLVDQETLVDILRRRIIDERREALVTDIQAAEREFQAGQCRAMTPDELMAEILA